MIKPAISAAILTGGLATRFGGKTKCSLFIGGQTILSLILETFSGIFREIIIVTNTPADFKESTVYKIVPDIIPGIGPLGGIHTALVSSSSKAVFVVAGDMPLISRDVIISQIEVFTENRPDVLTPRIAGFPEPLHSIYSKSVLTELERYLYNHKNLAVWQFFRTVRTEYYSPDNPDEAAESFMSVNSPADADIIERIIGKRAGRDKSKQT